MTFNFFMLHWLYGIAANNEVDLGNPVYSIKRNINNEIRFFKKLVLRTSKNPNKWNKRKR